ncbi:MAG TPA: class I SAM-dependent methyltransferase [Candidatus Saccharimonadales bacterium]|nr:class I SAM-dependent methyltransferase [Candidatus Saccharimonadales bacterium]
MQTHNVLRETFDEDAERYNQFRPHYPQPLFDKLITDTGINADSSLLEIGPGTGQATKPLARLGADITAIELGAALAKKAQQELQQYRNAHIITGAFEGADLPAATYDLIFSATAFHWIKDEDKFTKAAKLLKPEGYLAIIHTEHIYDEKGDAFYTASRPIYDTYWPPKGDSSPPRLPTSHDIQAPYIDSHFFTPKSFTVFPIVTAYSAKDYAGLLSTYSPVIMLPIAKRQQFLADIAALIDTQFAGKLEKHFAFTLTIAQKNRTFRR